MPKGNPFSKAAKRVSSGIKEGLKPNVFQAAAKKAASGMKEGFSKPSRTKLAKRKY